MNNGNIVHFIQHSLQMRQMGTKGWNLFSFCLAAFGVFLVFGVMGCSTLSAEGTSSPVIPSATPNPTQVVFLPTMTTIPTSTADPTGIPLPPEGHFYHGVFPGGRTGEEDDITFNDVTEYVNSAGKDATWVYFSNNWYHSRAFPYKTAQWIQNAGSVPYIRLMLRSDFKFNGDEPLYSLQNIIDGKFDKDLLDWCNEARNFAFPLLVEYGTEANSDSFPWSGIANGRGNTAEYGDPTLPDGPERFQDAFRHIVKLCREAGAVNITWVFHIDVESFPEVAWNQAKYYYPGDEWVDWIGVSIYGVYTPLNRYYTIFQPSFDRAHKDILEFAPNKPIIIAEFGSAKNNPLVEQAQWARDALTTITSGRYENVIGFAWWNEAWENDSNPEHNTTMRLQDNPNLAAVFRELVGNNPSVIGELSR